MTSKLKYAGNNFGILFIYHDYTPPLEKQQGSDKQRYMHVIMISVRVVYLLFIRGFNKRYIHTHLASC